MGAGTAFLALQQARLAATVRTAPSLGSAASACARRSSRTAATRATEASTYPSPASLARGGCAGFALLGSLRQGSRRRRRPPLSDSALRRRAGFGGDGQARGLFPAGDKLRSGMLKVSDGFEIYYEEHGSADGVPAVFLHGGPGAGCSARTAQFFDPKAFRVVLFDQRGCGKSKRPEVQGATSAQLDGNTTWRLVEDMELLREHLGISRWVVAGESWGSLLALAYASLHPSRVLGMALGAVCLFREAELEYFIGPCEAGALCPDAWKRLTDWLPWAATSQASGRAIAAAFRDAVLGLDRRLSPRDAVSRWLAGAEALSAAWPREGFQLAACEPQASPGRQSELKAEAPTEAWPIADQWLAGKALLAMHYVAERGFLEEGLLEAASTFRFPMDLIHGRHDPVCPVANARDLASANPGFARLHLTDSGHSLLDCWNIDAFVRATDALAAEVKVAEAKVGMAGGREAHFYNILKNIIKIDSFFKIVFLKNII
ncbi:unnamed protein product [Polarella glacialis]|uniref:prolyl aminopeptidase n=2 Tax=Polarella glacialis TaxID=89957 RepID=A0A813FKH7_POLGL|nr:unnamed protein product [Polarella glacialis]